MFLNESFISAGRKLFSVYALVCFLSFLLLLLETIIETRDNQF